jgi:hypothetical protein
MACKKSKQLALQYTLNEEFTNIVKPYQDRIDSLKGVKSSSQETIKINNGEIYNLEKLIEYSVLANALENNPLYKAEIAKKFPTNASSILDNFDRLSKVGL